MAMATRVASIMGRRVFGSAVGVVDRPPVDFRPSSAKAFDGVQQSIRLSCALTTRNRGSNHRSVASCSGTGLSPTCCVVHHPALSLSLAMPSAEHRAMTMASLAAARSMFSIREPASAEFTMGLCRWPVVDLDTGFDGLLVGRIQSQGVVEVLLQQLNRPHHALGPSFSAGPMFTSR